MIPSPRAVPFQSFPSRCSRSTGRPSPRLRLANWVSVSILSLALIWHPQSTSAVVRQSSDDAAAPKPSAFLVQPASTSLAGARVKLTAGTLKRQAGRYVGSYQLTVTPYFFKNETGILSVTVPDASLDRLLQGNPEEFSGSAVTNGEKPERRIAVKATPKSRAAGNL